jgi:hypothetical protein
MCRSSMWPSLVATDASSCGGGRLSGPTPIFIARLQPEADTSRPRAGRTRPETRKTRSLPQKDVIEVERMVTAPFAPMPKTIADGSRRRATVWGRSRVPGSPAAPIARSPTTPARTSTCRLGSRWGSIFVGWAGCDYRGAGRDVHDEHEWDKTLTADFDALILAPSNPSMSFRVLHTTRLIR